MCECVFHQGRVGRPLKNQRKLAISPQTTKREKYVLQHPFSLSHIIIPVKAIHVRQGAPKCPQSAELPLTSGEVIGHDEGTAADEDEVVRCGLCQSGGHGIGHGGESVADKAMAPGMAL